MSVPGTVIHVEGQTDCGIACVSLLLIFNLIPGSRRQKEGSSQLRVPFYLPKGLSKLSMCIGLRHVPASSK